MNRFNSHFILETGFLQKKIWRNFPFIPEKELPGWFWEVLFICEIELQRGQTIWHFGGDYEHSSFFLYAKYIRYGNCDPIPFYTRNRTSKQTSTNVLLKRNILYQPNSFLKPQERISVKILTQRSFYTRNRTSLWRMIKKMLLLTS